VHLNEKHAVLSASKESSPEQLEETESVVEGTFQELQKQLQLKSLPAGFQLNFPLLKSVKFFGRIFEFIWVFSFVVDGSSLLLVPTIIWANKTDSKVCWPFTVLFLNVGSMYIAGEVQ
jgi:hypothetical protein